MVVSIYQSSLIDLHTFVNQGQLSERFLQVLPDIGTRGYWLMLRMSHDELALLQDAHRNDRPKLLVIS